MSRLAYAFGLSEAGPEPGRGFAGLGVSDWLALEEGYGRPVSSDPVFAVYLAQQMLTDWVALPSEREARSLPEQRRARALRGMLGALQSQEGRAAASE
ncbi:hypothetical protein [Thalassovita aquimarina]|uniref:Uncharacterized protein n=1 Tax=Thalassovita aquimarina TaxID=2785917 RepID=A0ABS5HUC3_9RHOB|nr:hypothetical protein [Thalassovita aquimarina]MBR9652123.1 hypothetical protein [Thalassovita aquimarina]